MSQQANNGSVEVEEEEQTEWEYGSAECRQIGPGEQVFRGDFHFNIKLRIVRHQLPGVLDRLLATPLNEIPRDVSSFSTHHFYTSM